MHDDSVIPVRDHCHDHGRHIRHDHVTPQDCVDFYTRVLKLGCRCIERESPLAVCVVSVPCLELFFPCAVRLFDGCHGAPYLAHGGGGGGPHGGGGGSGGGFPGARVPLSAILRRAIAPFAFHASDFPLILAFECHCSYEQQEAAAKMIKGRR